MITFKFKSNTRLLQNLITNLQDQETIKRVAAKTTVAPLKRLIKETFDKVADPAGASWAPLKKPTGRTPLKGLQDFFKVRSEDSLVLATNEKPYAVFHQEGTKFIPARKFLPEDVIPTEWQNRIKPSIQRGIRALLNGIVKKEEAEYQTELSKAEGEGFGGG